jgi:hypothetical protein
MHPYVLIYIDTCTHTYISGSPGGDHQGASFRGIPPTSRMENQKNKPKEKDKHRSVKKEKEVEKDVIEEEAVLGDIHLYIYMFVCMYICIYIYIYIYVYIQILGGSKKQNSLIAKLLPKGPVDAKKSRCIFGFIMFQFLVMFCQLIFTFVLVIYYWAVLLYVYLLLFVS